MDDKIRIRHIDHLGGKINGDKLKDCYFSAAGDDTYDFYDKDNPNHPLKTGITKGSVFQFHFHDNPDLPWEIEVKSITPTKAHGHWFTGLLKIISPADDEGSGTFQAQAGGAMVPEESASSATA